MIVRPRPQGIEYFFLLRGSILSQIGWKLALTILTAVLVTASHGVFYSYKVTLTPVPFSLMGLALAIFLGFRNSASYDRFWEGRRLWGGFVNASRSLVRQLHTFVETAPGAPHAEAAELAVLRRSMGLHLAAFGHTLCHHLRGEALAPDIERLLPPEDARAVLQSNHPARELLLRLGAGLQQALRRGWLQPQLAQNMDRHLHELTETLGGCERIKGTPLPFSYSVLLHRSVYLYCYLLPFGLVDITGMLTPVVVGIVSYTFFGLDAIGDEIEEPFGTSANDLPLRYLSFYVEREIRAQLGDTDLPALPQPADYCLD